ncbi:glycosyltransferase family 39 protein [Clostridium frigidicarnis]|uniref:Dolichyl-phosphate-mannose-protein mannosyltransferase n=1 Tax=Clostridium frigidicarnis TaxID=84698 RepID=A0A1I1ASA0_9CLOT|nr:glycosyltransferase family 39 protein [Clostridium frigidicarnis]SFB40935.1 Dolichyl-phosphate-mannose-protein mannosyltransferase [Clostridium frigidicarnis]
MKNISYKFNKFLNVAFKILFLFILIGSVEYFNKEEPDNTIISRYFIIITITLVGATYYGLKNKYKKSLIVTVILMSALIIRFLWFYNIDSIPVGDFNRMFICAGDFLDGYTDMFKDTAYMARFPHMSMTVLYFALIRGTFSNPLLAIRLINIVLSMFNVVLLFFIAKEVFDDENKSIWVCLISALYPPMIAYNNVYCSENIAVPLLLLSIWMFLKTFNKNNSKKFLLLFSSGISLCITHLFRPIGYVMIIAYIMYIFIYFKDNIKTKIVMNLLMVLAFVIPLVGVSYTLIGLNITENPLWHGTEPPSISILKGTNLESGGRWNQDDSELFDEYDRDYEKVDKAAKEVIKKRLTENSPKDLLKFYTLKYVNQWYTGDFGGFYWSEDGLDEAYNKTDYLDMMGKNEGEMFIRLSKEGDFYTQLFFAIVLLLSYTGLYRKNKIKNYKIDIFYIIFCGISLQCLITESQDRYTYPFSWLFIILSMTAFSSNVNKDSTGGKNGGT